MGSSTLFGLLRFVSFFISGETERRQADKLKTFTAVPFQKNGISDTGVIATPIYICGITS